MLTTFEIQEMRSQFYECVRILNRIKKKIKSEEYTRRHHHLNIKSKIDKR